MGTRYVVVAVALVAVLGLVACGGDPAGDAAATAERHDATVDDRLALIADSLRQRDDVVDVTVAAVDDPPSSTARSDISITFSTVGADAPTLEQLVDETARAVWEDEELLLVGPLSIVGVDDETRASAGLGEVLGGDGATAFFSQLEAAYGPRPATTSG